MDHQCNHGCKHDRLKFCDKCKKVHCLDCGTEWPKQEIITYPVYPYVQPYVTAYPSYPNWIYTSGVGTLVSNVPVGELS
jgi:ABC-type antimicrobial peptide transport system ATPase subunit